MNNVSKFFILEQYRYKQLTCFYFLHQYSTLSKEYRKTFAWISRRHMPYSLPIIQEA